jgi:tetratricopeptide (TPR) repeat protein
VDSPQLANEAGERLAAAGRRADALGEPERASRLLERALELLPESSDAYVAALVELVAAGWNLIPNADRRRMLDTVARLAAERRLRAIELRARILDLGAAPEGSGAPSDLQMLELTRAGVQELQALPDTRALATALCTLAEAEVALGRSADGLATVERALEVLRAADEDRVWALAILGWVAVESPLPVAEGAHRTEQLMQEIGMRPAARSELLQVRCALAMLRGDLPHAWRDLEAARELERDLGRRDVQYRTGELHGRLLLAGGRPAEARREFAGWAAELTARGAESGAVLAGVWLGQAQLALGELDAAREAARAAIAARPEWNGYELRARGWQLQTAVELAAGNAAAALDAAERAVQAAAAGDWVVLTGNARLARAAALAAAADVGAARAEADSVRRLWEAKGYSAGLAQVAELEI